MPTMLSRSEHTWRWAAQAQRNVACVIADLPSCREPNAMAVAAQAPAGRFPCPAGPYINAGKRLHQLSCKTYTIALRWSVDFLQGRCLLVRRHSREGAADSPPVEPPRKPALNKRSR